MDLIWRSNFERNHLKEWLNKLDSSVWKAKWNSGKEVY